MAVDIGPKIGITGEAEFRSQLKSITETVKTYGAELKAVSTNTDGFSSASEKSKAKAAALQKEITAQKEKIEMLSKAVKESAAKYGEHDTRTEKWKQALANAQTQLNGMETELEECTKETEESSEAVEENGSKWIKLGDVVKTAGAAIGAAVAAASAAAVALGKSVVDSFADYEQLAGGVETLFKDSADAVQGYAESAYKTSGLSANEYMETVTGFSASLISSLGGNTEEAAKIADLAITDMSDNANKMGSDMSSIQDAYQGFAKQNYTMLDNLKLGYGGTKSEMERLIADANELAKAQGEAGDLTIESYADIVEAIHLVQTEMGITGTTAAEAEGTISGSIAMTQAAWENFLVSLGTGEGLEGALNDMMTSAMAVITNITPVVERIAEAIPQVAAAMVPMILEMLPTLLGAAVDLVREILEAVVMALPEFLSAIEALATSLWNALKEATISKFPETESVFEELETFISEAMESIQLVIQTVWEAVREFWDEYGEDIKKSVEDTFGRISEFIDTTMATVQEIVESVWELVQEIWEEHGEDIKEFVEDVFGRISTIIDTTMTLISDTIDAVWGAIQEIWENYGDEIKAVVETVFGTISDIIDTTLTAIQDIINIATAVINGDWDAAWNGIKQLADDVWEGIKTIVDDAINIVKDVIDGLFAFITPLWTDGFAKIQETVETVTKTIKQKITAWIDGIKVKLETTWDDIKGTVTETWDSIKKTITDIVDKAKTWGRDLIQNFVDGIGEKWEALKEGVVNVAQTVTDHIGFSEPKKGPLSNFHTYAPDMMQLYAKGIKENMHLVTDQMNALASGMAGSARTSASLTLTTPVYLDGRVIASVVNQQLGVLL